MNVDEHPIAHPRKSSTSTLLFCTRPARAVRHGRCRIHGLVLVAAVTALGLGCWFSWHRSSCGTPSRHTRVTGPMQTDAVTSTSVVESEADDEEGFAGSALFVENGDGIVDPRADAVRDPLSTVPPNAVMLESNSNFILYELPPPIPGMAAQIDDYVDSAVAEDASSAVRFALQLLGSTQASLKVAGSLMLADTTGLQPSQLRDLAEDPDVAVPLMILPLLEARARGTDVESIEARLHSKYSMGDFLNLASDRHLTDECRREALILAAGTGSPLPTPYLEKWVMEPDADISFRLTALLALGRSIPSNRFAMFCRESTKDMPGPWPHYVETVKQWVSDRANGGPIGSDDLNNILDGDDEDALTVLALALRPEWCGAASMLDPEVSQYLRDYLDSYQGRALSNEQRFWLKQLNPRCPRTSSPGGT